MIARDPFAYVGEQAFTMHFDAEESVETAIRAVAVFEDPLGDQKDLSVSKVGDGSDGIWEGTVPAGFFDRPGGWSVQLWVEFPADEVRSSAPRPLRIGGAKDFDPFGEE